jgi:hypothetical protein
LADQALADFAAKEGIALEPAIPAPALPSDTSSTSATTVKTMGPTAETTI